MLLVRRETVGVGRLMNEEGSGPQEAAVAEGDTRIKNEIVQVGINYDSIGGLFLRLGSIVGTRQSEALVAPCVVPI